MDIYAFGVVLLELQLALLPGRGRSSLLVGCAHGRGARARCEKPRPRPQLQGVLAELMLNVAKLVLNGAEPWW